MHLNCPECQNEVNLSSYVNLAVGNVIECDVVHLLCVVVGARNAIEAPASRVLLNGAVGVRAHAMHAQMRRPAIAQCQLPRNAASHTEPKDRRQARRNCQGRVWL